MLKQTSLDEVRNTCRAVKLFISAADLGEGHGSSLILGKKRKKSPP